MIKSANIRINNNINKKEVEPEYPTFKGNYTDLVLYHDDFLIGIENKIKTSVYNDLEDYAKT